jgi:oligoendopeptidase F
MSATLHGMSLLPFGDLAPHTPRRFLPANLDLGDWTALEPWVARLESAGREATTLETFETWLVDAGEVMAAIDEERARRYIAMTCHTANPEAEKAYLAFVEGVDPALKPCAFALSKLFLEHPLRHALPHERYAVLVRSRALDVELFREENVALETEEAKLAQQYQKLSGSLTVQFQGEERTLVQMGRFQEETDRAKRQAAWEAVTARWVSEEAAFDQCFDGLRALRARIASNAGFPDYRAYAFRARGRFDYTPEDCERFHDAIESEVVPVLKALHGERRRALNLDSLRPWDTAVDPVGRPPLRPFSETTQLEERSQRIFNRLDPDLAGDFRRMREKRLLDLANRKGKAPGGYQYTLSEARVPFIFMNAVGQQRDVETLLHEAGHAFHALASRNEPLQAYRDAPIEFCEVASMAMELLASDGLEEFYTPEEARRARRTHLEGIVGVFPWIATIDAFQHWIYTHPEHSIAERRQAWLGLMDRFGGDVDWTGFEAARACRWQRQLHLFIHPFYYVEYGIAQLGALQVWANAKKDPVRALSDYRAGLALGGSRPLPELFARAGCRFDFSRETLKPLLELVQRELAALG